MKGKGKLQHLAPMLLFGLIAVLFLLIPLLMILVNSVRHPGSGGLTLENFATIFAKPLYISAIRNSLHISLVSTAIALAVSVISANAVRTVFPRLRQAFITLLNITSNFAGISLAFAYVVLLGNVGVLVLFGQRFGIEFLSGFQLYSRTGLMILYVYFQIPLGTLLMLPALDAIQPQWKEAAALMQASPRQFWLRIGVPVLTPSILGTFSVLFSNSLAAYATAYALLMSNFPLLPINISNLFVGDIMVQRELGSALSVVMMAFMCLCVLVNNYVSKKSRKG